ncbi:hypothetical protein RclHR1_00070048 [Rhizophagus clarus]|uniref:Uncharacterized protein n=1 Tax=Rhizophagus clarus TaxID=94130 RepID=A0A2Z6RWI7_9GLOM|nr:hypothetical protein RclHR1_00070048 [Rhizophagus clarus]
MTELQQDFDENVNEEKNLTKPASTKVNDNEVGKIVPLSSISTPHKLDINSNSDEMTSNLDNQTDSPNKLNELIDENEKDPSNFSAIVNNDKQTSSPTISPISNDDRQLNPTTFTTLNELNNNSPNISTNLNESTNDKQNSLNDLSDDIQNSSAISDDKQSDDKQSDDKQINPQTISLTSNDDGKNDDKQIDSQTTSTISNDDGKINSQTTSPIFSDDKQIDSQTASNEDGKINSSITSSFTNDDEKFTSPTTSTILYDDVDGEIKLPTISSLSNDNKEINSPPNLYDDNSNIITNEPTSKEEKEFNQPPDTNKDSKHDLSEDNINSSAIVDESEIQEEKEQLINTNLHNNGDSFDEDGEYELIQNDKKEQNQLTSTSLRDDEVSSDEDEHSVEGPSKHGIGDSSYSFINEVYNNNTQLSQPPESIIEDPSKHESYNDDIKVNNEIEYSRDFDDKINNNKVIESNSDDNDYYDDDDSEDDETKTEVNQNDDETKTEANQNDDETKTEANQTSITDDNTFEPESSTMFNVSDYNSVRKDKVQVNDQQIRERRRPNQQYQESSSPENLTSFKNSNVRITDTHRPSASFGKIFKNVLFSVVFFAVVYFIYDINLSKKPSCLRSIADITDNIFEEINSVELPAINTISDYIVRCRSAANSVERSAIKSYGNQIVKGLRDIGEITKKSRDSLQYMYSKGSTLQTSFESEIEAILRRLDSNHIRQDDGKYIRDRLYHLTKKIKEIRLLVEKIHNHILDTKKIRISIEEDIRNGLKDAEKYNRNEKYSPDIDKAKKGIDNVDNTLSELYTNIDNLDKLREILNDYADKLVNVSEQLDEMGDKGVRILKADIKHLRLAVENTKVRSHNFNKLAKTD